jgi:hypothetical protein
LGVEETSDNFSHSGTLLNWPCHELVTAKTRFEASSFRFEPCHAGLTETIPSMKKLLELDVENLYDGSLWPFYCPFNPFASSLALINPLLQTPNNSTDNEVFSNGFVVLCGKDCGDTRPSDANYSTHVHKNV